MLNSNVSNNGTFKRMVTILEDVIVIDIVIELQNGGVYYSAFLLTISFELLCLKFHIALLYNHNSIN